MEDGKLIKDFVAQVQGEEAVLYKPFVGGSIKVVTENYGEYGLVWAVRYDADGKEFDRHNMKFISSITWVR